MPTSLIPLNETPLPFQSGQGPDTLRTTTIIQAEPGLPDIPGYEVLTELGRGGMGVVYKARDLKLKRLVAIKMLLDPEFASPEQRLRFKIEAEAVAQLKHPNIVQVYELGELPGSKSGIPHPYMVLEYIDGLTLYRSMRQQPLSERESAALMVTLARAMQHAHDHGLIHRDLKPANVLISREPKSAQCSVLSAQVPSLSTEHLAPSTSSYAPNAVVPKITDFGLVKTLVKDGEARRDLTRTELMVGTPQYMAPEQANPTPLALSCSVDIYSLGVILYELLTHHLPYDDGDILKMLMELQTKEPLSPRKHRPRLSVDLETICLKCLEKDPQKRYASAAALAEDLTRFLNHEPIHARPLSEWQRVTKWVRRHPAIASLAGLLFSVITIALIVIATLWREADADRQQAVSHAHDAEVSRDLARHAEQTAKSSESQAQLALYFSKIAQSDLLLAEGQLIRPYGLLRESGKSAALDKVRSWEWFHLARLCQPMAQHLSASNDYVQRVVFLSQRETLLSIEGAEYYGNQPADSYPGRVLVHEPDAETNQWKSHVGYTSKLPLRDLQLALGGSKALLVNVNDEVDVLDVNAMLNGQTELNLVRLPQQLKWKLAADAGLVALWSKKKPSNDVKLFDMNQGKVVRSIHLPGEVNELVVSDNGELIFFVLKDYTIGVWHIKDDALLWKKHLPQGEYRLAISGNAKQVAYCNYPVGDVVWMEAANANVIYKVSNVRAEGPVLSAEGDRLAVNSLTTADHDILVWRKQPQGEVLSLPLVLRGHRGFMNGYEFDKTGERMLTYGIDGSVRLWDTTLNSSKAGACLQIYRGHAGTVRSAAFDPQSKYIASGGIDANIMLWHVDHSVDHDLYPVGDGFSGEWISAYGFVAGTSTLAIFETRNSQIMLLDLQSRKIKQKFNLEEAFTGFRAPRYDCSFSGDGQWFTVVDKEMQRALVYETLTGKLIWATPKTEFKILQANFSGDSKRLFIAGHFPMPGGERKAVPYKSEYQVWDVEKRQLCHQAVLKANSQCWAINHDGSRITAALLKPGKVSELAVMLVNEKGKELYSVPFTFPRCMCMNFSPDGRYLAAVNFDPEKNWLTIHDAQTGKQIHKMQSVFESTHVTFTPDSRRVLVTGYDSHAIMFDPATGHEVMTLKHHGLPRQNDYALSPKLIFSQDGTKLAVHSWDAAITIWHAYAPSTKDLMSLFPGAGEDRSYLEEKPAEHP